MESLFFWGGSLLVRQSLMNGIETSDNFNAMPTSLQMEACYRSFWNRLDRLRNRYGSWILGLSCNKDFEEVPTSSNGRACFCTYVAAIPTGSGIIFRSLSQA